MKQNVLNHLSVKCAEREAQTTWNCLATTPLNCQGNHPVDSRDCMVWKREKEVNKIKYTNNISFPVAHKIVQSKNQFPTISYAQATTPNTETKHDHSCRSYHAILDKLTKLTLDSLPKFISELQSTLSESNKSQSSTSLKPQNPLLGKATIPLTGDLGKVLLLVRGSSWRKSTQKIALRYLRVRSQWSARNHHLPPFHLRPRALDKRLHRLQNLNVPSHINNHH